MTKTCSVIGNDLFLLTQSDLELLKQDAIRLLSLCSQQGEHTRNVLFTAMIP